MWAIKSLFVFLFVAETTNAQFNVNTNQNGKIIIACDCVPSYGSSSCECGPYSAPPVTAPGYFGTEQDKKKNLKKGGNKKKNGGGAALTAEDYETVLVDGKWITQQKSEGGSTSTAGNNYINNNSGYNSYNTVHSVSANGGVRGYATNTGGRRALKKNRGGSSFTAEDYETIMVDGVWITQLKSEGGSTSTAGNNYVNNNSGYNSYNTVHSVSANGGIVNAPAVTAPVTSTPAVTAPVASTPATQNSNCQFEKCLNSLAFEIPSGDQTIEIVCPSGMILSGYPTKGDDRSCFKANGSSIQAEASTFLITNACGRTATLEFSWVSCERMNL